MNRKALIQPPTLAVSIFQMAAAARGGVIVCLAYIGMSIFLQPPEWPAAIRDARFLNYAESGSAFLVAFLPAAYRPHIDNLGPDGVAAPARSSTAAGGAGPSQ